MRILTLALVVLALSACDGSPTPHTQLSPQATTGTSASVATRGEEGVSASRSTICAARTSSVPTSCTPDLGSGGVEPLGSEGSLVYGTFRPAWQQSRSPWRMALSWQPTLSRHPRPSRSSGNLFALEVDQPQGSATADPPGRARPQTRYRRVSGGLWPSGAPSASRRCSHLSSPGRMARVGTPTSTDRVRSSSLLAPPRSTGMVRCRRSRGCSGFGC